MAKTVAFLLPRTGEEPIGGFKVVYEYANRLAADGYNVRILYAIAIRPTYNIFIKYAYRGIRFLRYMNYCINKSYKSECWFKLNSNIKEELIYIPTSDKISNVDILIATSWTTAYWINSCDRISNNCKFYLIQHFENWHGTTDEVIKTWKMPLQKIVIAPWLQKIASELGENSVLIHNGIEHSEFYITIPIDEKDKYCATMLWHNHPFKACDVGLNALKIVKDQLPNFHAVFFGVPERPSNLPDWIHYYQIPEKSIHRDIVYNKSAIFVGPSSQEGWALTVPESMMCGCAVACTDIDGYAPSAINNVTALTSPVGDSSALASNIIKLITNDELRYDIAQNGYNHVKQFTWERAYNRFKEQIENPNK